MMRACIIEGLRCESVMRAGEDYELFFSPERVTLAQLEAANWAEPAVEYNNSILPDGYGYELVNMIYRHNDRTWRVTLRAARKHLGNIDSYTAQVAELQETVAARDAQVTELTDALAEADELAISLYEQLGGKDAEISGLTDALAEADELAISLYEQLGGGREEVTEDE